MVNYEGLFTKNTTTIIPLDGDENCLCKLNRSEFTGRMSSSCTLSCTLSLDLHYFTIWSTAVPKNKLVISVSSSKEEWNFEWGCIIVCKIAVLKRLIITQFFLSYFDLFSLVFVLSLKYEMLSLFESYKSGGIISFDLMMNYPPTRDRYPAPKRPPF